MDESEDEIDDSIEEPKPVITKTQTPIKAVHSIDSFDDTLYKDVIVSINWL